MLLAVALQKASSATETFLHKEPGLPGDNIHERINKEVKKSISDSSMGNNVVVPKRSNTVTEAPVIPKTSDVSGSYYGHCTRNYPSNF